ncbi:MAG: two component LuxR family transcriptional regulator [Comamonadaceae bacterium]|nr:MAG: two component LuxR family transcriptional regulator [Comamonadaceae bacterium]
MKEAFLNTQTDNTHSLIRIMLVEDDVNFQNALSEAIKVAPDMVLTQVAPTRAQGLQALELPQPDVLLVDLGLPDGSGIDVIRAAHARWPGCAIMVSTAFGDEAHVMRSIESGASGYLLKDSSPHRMVDEIRSLHAGGSPISPLIARQVLMRFRGSDKEVVPVAAASAEPPVERPARAALSEREREVLEFITKGFKAEEIARLMQVSRYTVLSFVRRIYAKLEVNSKAEAIYEARAQGLLDF